VSDPNDTDDQSDGVATDAPEPRNVARARPPGRLLRRVSIGLLCLLLVVLVAVVAVLPSLVAEREAERQAEAKKSAPVPAAAPTPAPPPEDAQRLAREKRDAENKLGIVLRVQTELEAEGVAVWGGEDYEAALGTLAAGDVELQAGRFAAAAGHYVAATAQLDALRASMPARLAAALEDAQARLANNDGPRARDGFAVALAIEPHNAQAQQGMLRARVLEDVIALIGTGAELEARGELDAARDKYASALGLDPRSGQARAAHEALDEKIRDRDFEAAMSVALTALEANDFAAARAALGRADAIRPGMPEVADTRVRLQLAVQRARIDTHRKAARALEQDERWLEASERYAAVLAIDASAAFARAGRERSLARARIHNELDAYIGAPGRLRAPGPRDKARRLLAAAGDPDVKVEPKLAAKVARLGKAIEDAETPMSIRLLSDNLTDVAVYKVGRFGRFSSRQLRLLPGNYVAVGTRPGYRDVRIEFTLAPGQEPADVTVLCQEKI